MYLIFFVAALINLASLILVSEREARACTLAEKGNFGKKYFWYGVAEDSCRKLSRMYEDMPYQSPLTLLYLDPKKEKNNFGRILSKKER